MGEILKSQRKTSAEVESRLFLILNWRFFKPALSHRSSPDTWNGKLNQKQYCFSLYMFAHGSMSCRQNIKIAHRNINVMKPVSVHHV